jgi:hypothetical protein
MTLIRPILVSLDTSTLGNLARDTDRDRHADQVTDLLNCGVILPFLSFHHVLELYQHNDRDIRLRRAQYLKSLKLIAFQKTTEDAPNIGDIVDLQSEEIMALVHAPGLALESVVNVVRAKVISGVCSGREFLEAYGELWDLLRSTGIMNHFEHKGAEIESIARKAPGDRIAKLPKPGEYKLRDEADVEAIFSKMLIWLTQQLREKGDRRVNDPEGSAMAFLTRVYREGKLMWTSNGSDPFLEVVSHLYGVDPERLPSKPTIEDVGYEAIFLTRMSVVEERLQLPAGTLVKTIRQEMVPSWRIWRSLDHMMRTSKAAGSNMGDRFHACYAPYVEWLQVDKRIREFFRQAAQKDQFLNTLNPKIFQCGTHETLRRKLESIVTV